MNKVILIGRLARDPELRTTAGNLSMANFTLAVSRPFVPNGGDSQADFISCVVWRRQAENLARYTHKGSQIAVEGRIQTRNYTANDGTKRYVTEVMCDNITFLGSRSDNQSSGASYNTPTNNYNNNNNMNNNVVSAPVNNSVPEEVPFVDNYNASSEDMTSDDPFKDFGEEISLSDDDLPF